MGKKKKKKQKKTVLLIYEGKREEQFFSALKKVIHYDRNLIHINEENANGGGSHRALQKAITKAYNYDKVYVLFDEDISLNDAFRNKLKDCWRLADDIPSSVKDSELQSTFNTNNRNPILIVSSPYCFDGFLLNLFGYESLMATELEKGKTPSKACKKIIDGIVGEYNSEEECYIKMLNKNNSACLNSNLKVMLLLKSIFDK